MLRRCANPYSPLPTVLLLGLVTHSLASLVRSFPRSLARTDEFVKGFQVFDKEGRGRIGAGELRYVLTQLGEKMTDEEVDELLKGFPVV